MYNSYYDIIEKCICDGMKDTDIIHTIFAHYGIRRYTEKNGRFYHIDRGIMKHMRSDIKEIRKNIEFMKGI